MKQELPLVTKMGQPITIIKEPMKVEVQQMLTHKTSNTTKLIINKIRGADHRELNIGEDNNGITNSNSN